MLMQARSQSSGRLPAGARPVAHRRRSLRLVAGVMLLGVFLSGCANLKKLDDPGRFGPFFTPQNHAGVKVLPASLHRVLVLPVYGGSVADVEATLPLDEVLIGGLQKKARFEVVALSREDCQRRFNHPEIASTAVLPDGFLEELGKAYGADAVLFVDLTIYHPYGSLAIGFRAKLATVHEVRLIWSFDDVFSLSDPAVVNSVHRYCQSSGAAPSSVDMTSGVLQSPRRFAAYVADAMFATLPPR